MTRTGQSTAGRAPMTASTTPAPVMSRFMVIMRVAGLDRVAAGVEGDALADQHDVLGAAATPCLRGVVQPDQPRRVGRALADPDDPAEALGLRAGARPRPRSSRPAEAATSAARSASQTGFFSLEGTRASVRDSQAARRPPWRAPASACGPRARPARRARRAPPAAVGLDRLAVEHEGAEDQPLDERPQAGVVGQRAQRRGDCGAALGPPGQRGRRPCGGLRARPPDPDEQDAAQHGVGQAGARRARRAR